MKKTIWITALALLSGFSSLEAKNDKQNFSLVQNIEIFNSVIRELNMYYVDSVKVSQIVKAGIDAMLMQLDPYTNYMPEEQEKEVKFMTTGEYGGIGSTIRQDSLYVVIAEPYRGKPADKAGLRAADRIIEINAESMKGKSSQYVSDRLKGQPGTIFEMKIERPGQSDLLTFSLKRENIVVPPITYAGILSPTIGYIKIDRFTDITAQEFEKSFLSLRQHHSLKGLVIDVRDNPGGIVDEAVKIVNMFIPKNQTVVTTKGKNQQIDRTYKTATEPIDLEIPIVVLTSRGSASASEILAGALQDRDRAVVIGQRTFGKGLVQMIRPLPYNGNLKITSSKYYIPSGRCVQAIDYSHRNEDGSVGVLPDSLIKEFTTLAGRIVKDGGGITPDVTIEQDRPANILFYLFKDNYLFDFATEYRLRHDTIVSVQDFAIDDSLYAEFKQMVIARNFTYDVQSEKTLKELKEWIKFEGYDKDSAAELEALELKLKHDLSRDLDTFRSQISELLSDEIIRRYFYQEGAVEQGLKSDKTVDRALSLLSDPSEYHKILTPATKIKK